MAGAGVHRALERARFGPLRTINVREGLLSGEEAARRVDGWMRAKQIELTGEVLVITGRGAGSRDGIAIVREAVVRVLNTLRRSGVVARIQEDTPGSFVVSLAPLRAVLDAPARRRDSPAHRSSVPDVAGLPRAEAGKLRDLALRTLDSLGVKRPSCRQVAGEMERQFSLLVRGAPATGASEPWLSRALSRLLLEFDDSE